MSRYVNERLRAHRIISPIVASVLAALLMLAFRAWDTGNESRVLLKTLAPHVAMLLETNDLLELQRFVATTNRQSGATIEINSDKTIVASSRSRQDIGTRAIPNRIASTFPSLISGNFVTTVEVKRPDGPTLNATLSRYVPLSSLIGTIVATFLAAFAGSLLISSALAYRLSKEMAVCLTPLEDLAGAVESLASLDFCELKNYGIRELDSVSTAINRTQLQLKLKTKELAESRANEIANESMRLLLHDLHTPITALRQMAKIANSDRHSIELREIARKDIVDLAEQLVGQITAGKQNLGMKIDLQTDVDLTATIRRITSRLTSVVAERNVSLISSIESKKLAFAHDPVMLERAISNLVVNAAEANASTVLISVDAIEGTARIRISDDGPGMNPQDVALFLKGRGRSSKSDRNGIGLSNTNLIARGHGSKLVFRKSRLGGSEFELRLNHSPTLDAI